MNYSSAGPIVADSAYVLVAAPAYLIADSGNYLASDHGLTEVQLAIGEALVEIAGLVDPLTSALTLLQRPVFLLTLSLPDALNTFLFLGGAS